VQPVVVSTLKVSAEPVYGYGELKQSLSLRATVSWKYLPPQRLGIRLAPPPETVVAALSLGPGKVLAGQPVASDDTSRTFLIPVAQDTWEMYKQGVRAGRVEARWLTSYGEPGPPSRCRRRST